jgi:E3 ubiquitin-protein ligase MARCH5
MEDKEEKRCWICLGEEAEEDDNWIAPCYCKGTVKYTHEKCLLRWIFEKQSIDDPVQCQSCGYTYVIQEPYNPLLSVMNYINSGINSLVPFGVLTLSSVGGYILAATFGGFAFISFVGEEGWSIIDDKSLEFQVITGLPLIPVTLILSRFSTPDSFFIIIPMLLFPIKRFPVIFSWPPSPILTLYSLPWIRLIYKKLHSSLLMWDLERERVLHSGRFQIATLQESEESSAVRLSLGALVFPLLSSVIGSFIPSKSLSKFHKSLIGGIILVFTKDVTSFIYRKIIRKQRRSRKIQNFHQDL